MTANQVHLSIRKGVLPMSLGMYNDIGDVDRTLDLIGSWTRTRKAESPFLASAPARAQEQVVRIDER